MGRLDEMKERYDQIPIPEELNVRIQQEIQKSRSLEAGKNRAGHRYRFRKVFRGAAAAAASAGILFTAALNASPVFAKEAAQLPVIGGLARVLTFRSYETEKDNIAVSVEIPTIEMIAQDTGINVDRINQEIFDLCNQFADDALRRAEEYRTAFLETGGTPEEWEEHDLKITVSYEIKQQNSDYISFVIRGTENWTNAYNESKYYNLDLNTGIIVTLKDMLGDDYARLVNETIREQIKERQKAGETFFTEEEGGFSGITEDTKFYINGNNRAVIVFEKYEIAPGSAGEIRFEVDGQSRKHVKKEEEGGTPQETQPGADAATEETEAVTKTEQTAGGYEDNFAVDSWAVREFAGKVKDAVAGKDPEALAALTSFPVYVGLPEAGVTETREDFLKLGADALFTDELIKSVEMADTDNLQPSMAGFVISDGGTAGINFGVADGVLAITGINY